MCDRHFRIPSQIEVSYKQLSKSGKAVVSNTKILQNIDFDFGAFGFRNHGEECAFVKNVFVEKS